MSTIGEITSTNYLYEDSKQFDSSWLKGVNLNTEVTKANKIQSSYVVAVAEAVNYVAHAALLGLSCYCSGKATVLTAGCFTLMSMLCARFMFRKNLTKEDIETFDHRKSYVQYFQAKAELVACLSFNDQVKWLAKECLNSVAYKAIAAACILQGTRLSTNENLNLNYLLNIMANAASTLMVFKYGFYFLEYAKAGFVKNSTSQG